METEVDATNLDDTADSQASQASTTSASSLVIQFSAEDLQENDAKLPPPASTESLRNEGKARRLNRRLALANLQLPKLSAKGNCVIDLCNDEDRAEDLAWFKKKFPNLKTDKAKAEPDVVLKKDMSPSKSYLPPSVASQRALKKDLEKKLARRRRVELEKRKELYMEDNEGLLADEDEEEDEVETKNSRTKKHVKKPIGSDDDSDEDEDYKGDNEEEEEDSGTEDSGSNDDEDDEEEVEESADHQAKNAEDLPESFDLFDGASAVGSVIKDTQKLESDVTDKTKDPVQIATQVGTTSGSKLHPVESLNLMLDEGFDSQPMPGISQPSFPNSLSQWFGDKPLDEKSSEGGEEVPCSLETPEFVNIGTFSDMDPFKDTGEEDVLMFCSGQFDTQNLTRKDTSIFEEPTKCASVPEESTKLSVAYDDEEEVVHKSSNAAHKKSRKVIESDEENEANESILSTSNKVNGENVEKGEFTMESYDESMSPLESEPTEPFTRLRRTVIDSDEEDDTKEEDEDPVVLQEEKEDDDEEEQNGNEEEEEENDEDQMDQDDKPDDYIEKEADEYDSDDELAVIRRLQRSEFERKANREKWFDDEASLSGDDVGSDVDEDGDVANEYEAEEGDADDVPDSESIRRQNHRLLLKQEKDREHVELIRLQDRLLADGDLGGTETNRTFRLKLREVTTIEDDDGDEEVAEEEEDTSSQAHAKRVSAIKWLIEHEEEYKKVCDNKEEEEDLFDTAIRSVEILPEVSALSKAPRTLLGQNGLENAIKEVAGATFAKQLYVNNHSAAVKRPSSPVYQVTKKMRSSVSVLSILEQQ